MFKNVRLGQLMYSLLEPALGCRRHRNAADEEALTFIDLLMPTAKETFESSIKDASGLLDLFDQINIKPPPPNAEVLKRAGLIMACTAWETYVEDRVAEAIRERLGIDQVGFSGQYVLRSLQRELKQFNNPNSEKTVKLFRDFLDLDVSRAWVWNNYDSDRVKLELDTLIKKRGDAVHRSKQTVTGNVPSHLIKRGELERAVRFLKSLVDATDKATDVRSPVTIT